MTLTVTHKYVGDDRVYTTKNPNIQDLKQALVDYRYIHKLLIRDTSVEFEYIDADLHDDGELIGYCNYNGLTGKYSYEGILKGVA